MIATAIVIMAAAAPAHAQSAAPVPSTSLNGIAPADLDAYPGIRAHVEQGNYAEALSALQAVQAGHSDDPAYFNLLGILALKLADYATAVTALERVVLMQPDNAGAWLDLAIASAETGNITSAAGYFDYVESQFNPPPSVRVVVSRYRARMTARSSESPWQSHVDFLYGVDTNANSGLQTSAIPLTFGADRINLILDPSFQARTDHFMQAGVGTRYRTRLGSSIAELSVGVRSREYLHEKNFSTISANASAGLHRATLLGDASAWLHLERLWLGGSSLLNNLRAIAQIERPMEGCRLGGSAELEWRRYTTLKTLDANVIWGQGGIACDWKAGQLPVQTILIGRVGFDDPTGPRAGGQTRHKELIGQVGMPLAWGARADLSMTVAEARDDEGYSPLLEQNAARTLDRHTIRFSVVAPVSADMDLQLLAEDNRFKSNLALFRQSGKSLSVGLRYRF
ncbi:tetratricopeptide repeat protein [Noviherbaspirillum denitrificans]|uniref:Uncharacterized protein n=1 Tax=Noviherbaspirillum denitrificans TaxID=1968433 RepID=A0A254T8M0_9BURK|nr:tetratricopeptide repeat protein [Noviherbaspirillum denitrificans]OWW19000.1 hypothetical protein AYR66_05360 [Noviherbaspirillum denitrificans]